MDQSNLKLGNSGSKGSNPLSGKSGLSGRTGNWAQAVDGFKLSGPQIMEDDEEGSPGSPFMDLQLKDNMPSEPTNAKNRKLLG